jgi:hypothetical protein
MDGPGNTSIDADGNRAIIIREIREVVPVKVRSFTDDGQKPTSLVEIMND